MSIPGEKGKLVGLLDNALADEVGLSSVYKIEITFSRSPKGVKCGAITVFRNNSFDLAMNPLLVDTKKLQEMEKEISKQTEVMSQDPVYFREDKGQWIDWAITEALKMYDRFGGADIIVKAPRLRIREVRSSSTVAMLRNDTETLFKTLRDIDALLSQDFRWDPWSRTTRRGKINALMGKR